LHEFGAGTHVGNLRDNNEDSFVCDPEKELWIVADGMGGLGFGEVASAISTHTVATQVNEGHGVNQAIELAHKRIKAYADNEGMGTNMGTTMVLLLSQGSLYNIFWVGDSRAYLFDSDQIKQLTTDHSLVQSLIEQGEITQEEAKSDPRKNAVTRALGVQELETVRADSVSEKWQPNQKILLCSDGLTDCVSSDDIAKILAQDGTDQSRVDNLIVAALAGGGKDNITIIVVSASENAKKPESDTHVPANVNDSTYVPMDSGTKRNTHQAIATNSPQGVSLPSTASPSTASYSEEVHQEAPKGWFNLQNWIGAFAMVIAVIVFARLTTADRSESTEFPVPQMVQLETEDAIPVARQGIPDIKLPETGTVLQLGLFSRLEGAEIRQQEASRQGYVPFIEKKISMDEVQYVVLLGPYYDQQSMLKTSNALEREGIKHFQRPDAQY
jgi:serine/threonine protein phosphatase PrpC